MILIDPPTGWRYGFPKPDTRREDQTLAEWLVENGYPQRELDRFPEAALVCRYIEIPDGDYHGD